ncbi:hypothetical protein RVR_7088 [Actinacidiphila reveromycinica]|uniref:LysM domain-containing protein n=1 Tax=Actinacidiphila reveromycinica TaxID=659352 RepID=A0A7U3UWN8_9ACTN|nr:LysM peptidoglycan-binding domain-containing protein [Streptomyces sp. SN-593]BBB00151.1 hypothetical protein RVR_7088 [Streptomyces sp. SN-593]
MPKHAQNRSANSTQSLRKRLFSTRGAVVAGTFTAIACAALSGTAQAAEPSAAKSAPQTADATHGQRHSTFTDYTVKTGDYLIAIARAHNSPGGWHAIARANGLHSPYIIHPGQVLKLPTGTATTAKPESAAPKAAAPSPAATTSPASTTASDTSSSTTTTATQTYPDNLDGWINEALAIMKQNGIPGTYDGIYRNVMRESSGNPNAINLWDSNAAAGTPSKGLLQTIQPTFDAYHVAGTSTDIYDPVANIVAACNYAFHVYGSIDNVNGPY